MSAGLLATFTSRIAPPQRGQPCAGGRAEENPGGGRSVDLEHGRPRAAMLANFVAQVSDSIASAAWLDLSCASHYAPRVSQSWKHLASYTGLTLVCFACTPDDVVVATGTGSDTQAQAEL
jgi:hypothetical protein